MNMEQIIRLELTVTEVNTILSSLGKHPFEQIAVLIGKIKNQGDPQVDAYNQQTNEVKPEATE